MPEEEEGGHDSSSPSGWRLKIAILVVIVALWNSLSDHALLSIGPFKSPTSVLTVLLTATFVIAWTSSLVLLPLWIAYLTDARNAYIEPGEVRLHPADLSTARMQMAEIVNKLSKPTPALHTTSIAVETLIEDLMRLIIRDFVQAWHSPLLAGQPDAASPSKTHLFPKIVEHTIKTSLSAFIDRLNGIDLASLGVSKILPILTEHMKAFEAAETQWKKSASSAEILEDDESELFLAALYSGGQLHPALGTNASADTRLTELDYLRSVAIRILKAVLPQEEAASKGVFILVKEIMACTVMKTVIEALSDPDTLNALLEEKASAALQEQKLVNQLRDALDKQDTKSELPPSSASIGSPKGRLRSGEASFEHLLESIQRSKSILEARRIKNGIVQQLRRSKAVLADESKVEARKRNMISIYMQRLQAALEAVDQRMHQLGSASVDSIPTRTTLSPSITSKEASEMTLRDVLTSSAAISHFLEITEARKRSIFVKFWMSVNTFKYPLELAESDGEEDAHTSSPSMQLADKEQIKTLCEDLRFFLVTYYQSTDLVHVIGEKHIASAKDFLVMNNDEEAQATIRSVSFARRSVVQAQRRVYEEMLEVDWPAFVGTTAWHQAAEDLRREKEQETPTLKTSSSVFLDRRPSPEQRSPRPSANRTMSHAHLFGLKETLYDEVDDGSSLFGDETDDIVSQQGLRSQPSYDKLLGSKGSTFDSTTGRTPLFREALFEEDDKEDTDGLNRDMSEKEALIQVDKMDAMESVLASLIREDLPSDQPSLRKRQSSGRSSSTLLVATDEAQPDNTQEKSTQDRTHTPPLSSLEDRSLTSQARSLYDVEKSIRRLQEQESMLDALIRKAELTGSSAKEMRLLEKSKSTVARELRELAFERKAVTATVDEERSDYQAQMQLKPGLTRLQIRHSTVSMDIDGREYATYLIEVSMFPKDSLGTNLDNVTAESGWVVSRRYNEFYLLHSRLKERIMQVRALEHYFPGKRFAGQVSSTFLETRRIGLQRYLQEIIRLDAVCDDADFLTFLSQMVPTFSAEILDRRARLRTAFRLSNPASASRSKSDKGLASRLYKGMTGVAGGLDDLLFGPSMYEIVVSRLSNGVVDLVGFNEMEKILSGATTSSPAEIKEATQVLTTSFTTPICDIIIELFQLKLDGNWFRRQAVIIVAQQALGGTIERRVRQSLQAALTPTALQGYIATLKDVMWPDGKLKQPGPMRSIEEKRHRSRAALKKLSTLIPTVASTFIGRDNARRAARRSWAMLQNRKLNKHLIYTVLDEFIDEIFPHEDKVGSRDSH